MTKNADKSPLNITLDNVGHGFSLTDGSEIKLFSDVSMQIKAHQVTSIMGHSGSGKSTLLAIIAGLHQPNQGQVSYQLQSGQTLNTEQFRQRSGFVFQHFHLLNELDTLNNVALPLRLRGDKNAFDIAADWLDKVGLAARSKQPVNRLSGGEQQRVAIARAFAAEPDVVFADEPTGSLDEMTADKVFEVMFRCSEQNGNALVLVTHNEELSRQATQQFRLSHGKLEVVA